MTAPVAGTRRDDAGRYEGVLRVGRRIVAECGHSHQNRDWSTKSNGRSARDCIGDVLRAAGKPVFAAELVARTRNGWQKLQRGPWQYSAAQVERFKTAAAADADALEALIARVRDMLGCTPG